MNDELNVRSIMKAVEIFDKFRYSLALRAGTEVGKIGGDAGAALSRALKLIDGDKQWMPGRLGSMALLERTAWRASLMPKILQSDFGTHDFLHEAQTKEQLVSSLGRALVAIENHAHTVWWLRGDAIPRGDFSRDAKDRMELASSTTFIAYLIASYVKELKFLPADQFARVLHESQVTGRAFMVARQEYVAHHMDPGALVDATTRGFMLGHELACSEPTLDDHLREVDLKLSPLEVRQLAFSGRHSFPPVNLVEEFSHGRHSHQSDDLDPLHAEGAGTRPQAGLDAARGPVLSIGE